ncbi:hypothetical protein PHOSAC3_120758 [Mesotoga infera]|nr:hypothetical protein PHOSAC3_120758 [Mesotoga infera]
MVFLRAEQNAHGRLVSVGHHVFPVPAHISVELSEVFVIKGLDLQLHQHMALKDAVVENQVNETVCITDQDPLLAGFKAESVAKLQKEIL